MSISSRLLGCIFRSARYTADFKTEKSQRIIFKRTLIELGTRHRKSYNTRHAYAVMLLMAGANINWVANQLGNSPLMIATVYGKWINGQADKDEMAKLNTRTQICVPEIAHEEEVSERDDTVKTGEFIEKEVVPGAVATLRIGGKLAEKIYTPRKLLNSKGKVGRDGRI